MYPSYILALHQLASPNILEFVQLKGLIHPSKLLWPTAVILHVDILTAQLVSDGLLLLLALV